MEISLLIYPLTPLVRIVAGNTFQQFARLLPRLVSDILLQQGLHRSLDLPAADTREGCAGQPARAALRGGEADGEFGEVRPGARRIIDTSENPSSQTPSWQMTPSINSNKSKTTLPLENAVALLGATFTRENARNLTEDYVTNFVRGKLSRIGH